MAAHDIQGYVKALDRFYETLCAGSGNLVARRILHTLQGRMSYLRAVTTAKASQSRERETVQLMQEMAEAARRRDPVEVAHRCRAFVDRSAAFAIHVLSEKAVPESSPP